MPCLIRDGFPAHCDQHKPVFSCKRMNVLGMSFKLFDEANEMIDHAFFNLFTHFNVCKYSYQFFQLCSRKEDWRLKTLLGPIKNFHYFVKVFLRIFLRFDFIFDDGQPLKKVL